MKTIEIPGWGDLRLEHLVLDFNGTLAQDGILCPGTAQLLRRLGEELRLWVITADTNGTVRRECSGLPLEVVTASHDHVAQEKRALVRRLGSAHTACIGNGRNDVEMFEESALSIAVMGREGCFAGAALAADLLTASIQDALELLLLNHRLIASLRG